MTPKHAIFRAVYEQCLTITESVYDYVPGADAQLPFMHVARGNDHPSATFEVTGSVTTFVRMYGRRRDQGLLDRWSTQLHDQLLDITRAHGYGVRMRRFQAQDMNIQSEEPMVGTAIMLEFNYNN